MVSVCTASAGCSASGGSAGSATAASPSAAASVVRTAGSPSAVASAVAPPSVSICGLRAPRRQCVTRTVGRLATRRRYRESHSRCLRVNSLYRRLPKSECLACLLSDGDLFLANIDNENRIRQTTHSLDAGKVFLQTLALAIEFDALFLGHLLGATIRLHQFEIF